MVRGNIIILYQQGKHKQSDANWNVYPKIQRNKHFTTNNIHITGQFSTKYVFHCLLSY